MQTALILEEATPGKFTYTNNLHAYVARALVDRHPELHDFFTFRALLVSGARQEVLYASAFRFLEENPAFEREVLKAKARGLRKVSIKMFWEPWRYSVEADEILESLLQAKRAEREQKSAN